MNEALLVLTAEYLYDPQGRRREERAYDGQGKILNRTLCEYDLYGNLQTKQIPECGYYELHEYANPVALPCDSSRKGSMHRVTVFGDSSAPSVVTESYTDIAGNEENNRAAYWKSAAGLICDCPSAAFVV